MKNINILIIETKKAIKKLLIQNSFNIIDIEIFFEFIEKNINKNYVFSSVINCQLVKIKNKNTIIELYNKSELFKVLVDTYRFYKKITIV